MNRGRAGKQYGGRHSTRHRGTLRSVWILVVLAAAVIIYGAVELVRDKDREAVREQIKVETTDHDPSAADEGRGRPEREITVGGVKLTGLTPGQAREKLKEAYRWDMKVTDGEESVSLEDVVSPQLDKILDQIESGGDGGDGKYDLDYGQMELAFKEAAAGLAQRWDRGAADSQMESFHKESGTYSYTKERYGRSLRQDQLAEELMKAARDVNFSVEIKAEFDPIPPKRTQEQARDQYKVIGTFATTTTNNKNRNQNIRLASDAIDGIVLKPGEEFSFNLTTGNRTSDKGYQPAGAYKNGVLIEEPGGGVCQVSTTLYHAIVNSGYRTTERNFHSFAPSYIEKGQDAMVSFDGYDGPDLKFVNTQDTSIGLRASFDGTKLKLSIVGLPLLEGDEQAAMRSEKIKELEPPNPVYEENPALAYGEEKVVEQARPGSVWKTYRILSRNGQIVDETFLHTSTYKAKPARIQKNSAALPQTLEEQGIPAQEGQAQGVQAPEQGGQRTEQGIPAQDGQAQSVPAQEGQEQSIQVQSLQAQGGQAQAPREQTVIEPFYRQGGMRP